MYLPGTKKVVCDYGGACSAKIAIGNVMYQHAPGASFAADLSGWQVTRAEKAQDDKHVCPGHAS